MTEGIRVPFGDLRAQNASLGDDLNAAIARVINSCAYIAGPEVAAFEGEFARYQDSSHCIGVANGTDALEIALQALSLPADSEVIVPANTFIATAEAVTRSGLTVVFADVDDTYTLDLESVRRLITNRTSAIVPVHLYGQAADMDAILGLAAENGLRVIEDCAQAHGAEYRGQRVGSFGDIATFSFYPGKNLGALGDAGAIVTSDDLLAEKCRLIANHGRLTKYDHVIEGRNSRLDTLQAAILQVKLRALPAWTDRRREVARTYRSGLADLPGLVLPTIRAEGLHVFHLFVVRVAERDAFREALLTLGVQTGVHYPEPLPLLPPYRSQHAHGAQGMNAVSWSSQLVSLPIHESLTDPQVTHVVEAIQQTITR